jgi:hypothetical protein
MLVAVLPEMDFELIDAAQSRLGSTLSFESLVPPSGTWRQLLVGDLS